jgi:tetratricopeptide (TPR) repeat protein
MVHERVAADPQRFGPAAEVLVRQARRAHDHEALVLALRARAWGERALLAGAAAKRLLDEAARIARRHRLPAALADVLTSRAAVNQELGRLAAASRDLDAAAALGPPERMVELAFQRAVLHQNIGRLAEAAASYRELLADAGLPPRTRILAGNNLAMIESQHGRHPEALRLLADAAPRAEELGPALVALVAQTRAWVTVQSGRLTEGLRLFEKAAHAYESANLPLGEHYVEYADLLMDLRLVPEAIRAARWAAEEFRAGGVPLMGAEAQLRVAQLAMLAGDARNAEAAATSTVDSFDRQGRGAWKTRALLVRAEARLHCGTATAAELREARRASRTLESLGTSSPAVEGYLIAGRIAASLGRTREAVDNLRHAADLARRAPVLVRLRGQVAAALGARLRRRDDEVLTLCRRGLSDLARHRTALPSVELRALASGHGAELGQLGLEVVVRDGTPARVLGWLERTRAAALLAVEPADVTEFEDDLQALRTVHAELEVATRGCDRAAAVPASLRARQLAIESRIRRATWHRHSATTRLNSAIDPPRLRHLLGGRVLVEYGQLAGELLAVVVEPRRSRLVPLGPSAPVLEQLRALFFALRRLAQPRAAAALAAARLSADFRLEKLRQLLLTPLRLVADGELVIVPVGALHGVPWSALHDGPVSLAPSATFWARTRQAAQARDTAGADGRVILVEGPNLPGATAEVRLLRRMYPGATVLTPPASTAETVARTLSGAELAHLACHGWLRSDNPMFSSLVLSDGPLTVQELETRGVAPHRLVLASCQSGADVSFAGDEVLGFVSALLARGTAGIVASIAAIPDVAAVDLMSAVHERLTRGATLAHALHAGRAAVDREEPGAYVNWCTFNAYGAA